MKISKKATSIVEAMIVTMIVSLGVVGMYKIYFNSSNLIDSTENKIKAIDIAREGIEAITNIRDTNWLILGSDYKNCWNTLNYNTTCIGSTTTVTDIPDGSGGYIIYKDLGNNWKLKNYPTGNYSNATYRSKYRVGLSGSGFYTQTGTTNNLKPVFTREIQINYIENTSTDTNGNIIPNGIDSNDEKMKIISIVRWGDRLSTKTHEIKFEKILSNWKNKN